MEWITHFFYDAIAANEYLWFIEDDMNALFKMNIKTLKMEYVLSFPNELTVSRLYKFIGNFGDKLICCPRNAKMMAIYDTVSGDMKTMEVDFSRYKSKSAKMYGCGDLNNKMYFGRQGYSEIYQFDVQVGELTSLNVISDKVELGIDDYFWHGRIRQYKSDTEILLYNFKYNAFYQYNVVTSEMQKIISLRENQKLIDFVTDGHFIWGLIDDGILYKWDGFRIIDHYEYDITGVEFAELLLYKNKIYIVDVLTGRIVSSLMSNTDGEEDITTKIPNNDTGLFNYCFAKDDYFWLQWKDGLFYYYDGIDEVSGIFESDLGNIPAMAFLPKDVCRERKDYSLCKLLKIIKYQQGIPKRILVEEAGTRIHNVIMLD